MAIELAKFFREVRQESDKVTWPTRKETVKTTVAVLAMSVIAAIFFLVADSILKWSVDKIMGIGT